MIEWLFLAESPIPIPETPRINLHESRAPKRVALQGARQPGARQAAQGQRVKPRWAPKS